MKKFYIFFILLFVCYGAFSQEISVRFIGQINGTDYCRLDSVSITNITRNWTETVEYPDPETDSIIVLGGTSGITQNLIDSQGLGQNAPNPFDCETRVELSVPKREDVRMQLLDAMGKVNAEYCGHLEAGVHTFDISTAAPQTYVLNATVGSRSYSIRMVNVGNGCGSSIKYAGISGCITAKQTRANEFHPGDNMRYVGYATIDGELLESAAVEQPQTESEDIILNFTHYSRPTVVTLVATGITTTSATLNGNIVYDGGNPVTEFGFVYGTSPDVLSSRVQSISEIDDYSADISGLISNTIYYYKAYATNMAGTSYGGLQQFTTISEHIPTVQTNEATGVLNTSATLSGNVTSTGIGPVIARGFMYGTNASNFSSSIECGSGTGSFSMTITDLIPATTYYYKAYATNSAGTAYGEVMSFTTYGINAPTGYTNGHGYVDLGLPSGTLWATCNEGADSPEDYGNYFAWGEIFTRSYYDSDSYSYCVYNPDDGYFGENNSLTKYCNNAYYGYNGFTDTLTTLVASDDAATRWWGTGWRMPTYDEQNELKNNCTIIWIIHNGVNGCLFTGPNGNSIFLPAAGYRLGGELYNAGSCGYYWSSSLDTDNPGRAWNLYFNSDGCGKGRYYRRYGFTVRAVCSPQN